jgi:hypothetical protein
MLAADNCRLSGGGGSSTALRRVVFCGFGGKCCASSAQRQGAGGDLEELVGNDDIRLAPDLTMTRFLLSRRVGSPRAECGPASEVQAGLVSSDCERRQAGGSTQRQSARPVGEFLIAEHVIMLALAISSPLTMAPLLCLAGDRGQDWRKRRRDMACLEMLVAGGRRLCGDGALSKALRRFVFLEFGGECSAGGAQRQRAGGDLEELVGGNDIRLASDFIMTGFMLSRRLGAQGRDDVEIVQALGCVDGGVLGDDRRQLQFDEGWLPLSSKGDEC